MRKNLPVTQKIHDYPPQLTLISITDLKGRITYCNDDFVSVSGYPKEELLGQAHNILRHPDMPEEAFRDFWATIQAGKLWSAVIKNRRKNGDAYWVRANATPMRNGDRIVGYLSVRTLPSADEIDAAQRLFSIMRKESERGRLSWRLRDGLPVRSGLLHAPSRCLHPGRQGKALLLGLLAAAGPSAAAALGFPMWGILAAGVLTTALAWRGILRFFAAPVDHVAEVARHLASGDLSEFIAVNRFRDARDLMLPVNQLALMIRTVIWDVRQFLSNDAHVVADHSQEMLQRAEQQAEGLSKSAAAIEQIDSTISQTSDMTKDGTRLADETAGAVRRSQDAVETLSETMRQIDESSRSVSDFVQVIESVAFQTNILALNAAVEAARAGEHGRGFAVVASEVRTLSQRTADAARQIRHLIEQSHDRVRQGNQGMEQTRARMGEVAQSVERQGRILKDINLATEEQATGIQEASIALRELDQITKSNALMAEGLAQLARKMESNSRASLDNVRIFRLSSNDKTHAETDAVELRRMNKADVPLLA
ncbi:methyl-accepting chemotaxis protein [Castellaniella sp.]|uniref:methyl-accepting chemotaxis protein n=1 Tax=Castellaniella sp. TaxID=1955812 RepID=UPI002AFF4295|nr:methyl-accepting chemotaxis protein [Castellaniella sp.]